MNTPGPKNTTRATCAHNKPNPGETRAEMRTKIRGMPHQGHWWSIHAPFHKIKCRSILRFTPSSQSMSQEMRRLSAYTRGRSPLYHTTPDPRPKARGGTRLAEAPLSYFYSNAALLCFRSDSSCSRRFAIELSAGLSCDEPRSWICSRGMRSL